MDVLLQFASYFAELAFMKWLSLRLNALKPKPQPRAKEEPNYFEMGRQNALSRLNRKEI